MSCGVAAPELTRTCVFTSEWNEKGRARGASLQLSSTVVVEKEFLQERTSPSMSHGSKLVSCSPSLDVPCGFRNVGAHGKKTYWVE